MEHRIIYYIPLVNCPLESDNRKSLEECKACIFHEEEIIDNITGANHVKCSYQESKGRG